MTMKRKIMCLLFSLVMVFSLIAVSGKVNASGSYTVEIGQTRTLLLSGGKSVVPGSVTWRSSDSRIIAIQSSNTLSCTVEGVSSDYGDHATITCNYAYLIAGTSIRTSESFFVSLKGTSSSEDSYELVPSYKTVCLDCAGTNQKTVHVSVANFSNVSASGNFEMTAQYHGNCISVSRSGSWYNSGVDFVITAKPVSKGTETVKIIMTKNGTQVSSANIIVNVTCTHVFGEGVVTEEATESRTGTMTYACSICHIIKTEVIPKLEPSEDAEEVVEDPSWGDGSEDNGSSSWEDDSEDSEDASWGDSAEDNGSSSWGDDSEDSEDTSWGDSTEDNGSSSWGDDSEDSEDTSWEDDSEDEGKSSWNGDDEPAPEEVSKRDYPTPDEDECQEEERKEGITYLFPTQASDSWADFEDEE